VPARVRRRHAGGGLGSYLAGSRALVTPRAIFKVSVRRFDAPAAGSTLADASHVCPLSSVSFQRLTFESPPFACVSSALFQRESAAHFSPTRRSNSAGGAGEATPHFSSQLSTPPVMLTGSASV